MLVDHHLHLEKGPYTPENYPRSWLDRYVDTMRQARLDRLGVVEHGYRFLEAQGILDLPWAEARCHYRLEPFVDFILRAKDDGYPVLLGVEMDYVPGKEERIWDFLRRAPWDFVIGSVHFLGDWGIDLAEESHRWQVHDPQEVWERYYETMVAAVESRLFDILSHPDLPKIFGHRPPDGTEAWYPVLATALAEAGMAMEVNTAGLRKPIGEIYPNRRLLAAAREAGVPITVGSDAHTPDDVGKGFSEALSLLINAGYRESAAFDGRRRILSPLPGA
jgi:histidinol-phosphatase (PHP family)